MYNIAIVSKWGLSYGGGGEKWLIGVIKKLSQNGINVEIYVPKIYENEEKTAMETMHIPFIFYNSLSIKVFHKLNADSFVWPFVGVKLKKKYDAIYIPSIYPLLFILRNNVKVVIGTHDFYLSNKKISRDCFTIIVIAFLKLFKRRQIAIHSINSSIANKFRGLNVHQISNFSYSHVGQIEPYQDNTFRILFINILNKRKGAQFLVDLALRIREIKDIELIICGKDVKKIGKKINTMNFQNTRYIGYVNEEEKLIWLKRSKVFLLLSDREAAPLSVLDAISSGLPIVSTWAPLEQMLGYEYQKNNAVKIVKRKIASIYDGIFFYYNLWKDDNESYCKIQQKLLSKGQIDFSSEKQLNEIQDMFLEIIK